MSELRGCKSILRLGSHFVISHKINDTVPYCGRLFYRQSPVESYLPILTHPHTEPQPGHVTCFGQWVISRSEASIGLVSTIWLVLWNPETSMLWGSPS